ncbi:MAG: ABC transporter ATP-binding protein [Anaerolineae bacterium]|nr:ABC transporter ATP-binding protein [Anaerolineae bacterium]
MIHLDDVTFAYPPLAPRSPASPVLNGCSLRVESGGALAVMGASGAGKSTLGYVLAGLAPRHTGGTLDGGVYVGGQDITGTPPEVGVIGLLFQDAATQLFNTSVEDEIAWGLEAMRLAPATIGERVEAALRQFELLAVRHRAPWALSGGQQKRLALAALWAMRPRVLILDEPLGGLDPQGRTEVLTAVETLRQSGTALLITTLRPQAAQQSATVAILAGGRLGPARPATDLLQDTSALIQAGLAYPPDRWPDLGPANPPSSAQPALEITGLHFGYTAGEEVLQGIDLTITQGEFIAVVGPNGAGKSTLARHMNGLLRPARGAVRVLGEAIEKRATGVLARKVGYLFQRPEQQFFAPTVRQEIEFGLNQLDLPDKATRLAQVLARFDLTGVAGAPPATLGYGAQRAVTLASIAALTPPIVVLDEPTVGLDGRGLAQLLQWLADLRKQGTTIILVTHEETVAARADRTIALDAGRVVADGAPEDVLPRARGWVHEL